MYEASGKYECSFNASNETNLTDSVNAPTVPKRLDTMSTSSDGNEEQDSEFNENEDEQVYQFNYEQDDSNYFDKYEYDENSMCCMLYSTSLNHFMPDDKSYKTSTKVILLNV